MHQQLVNALVRWTQVLETTQKRWKWLGRILVLISWVYIIFLIIANWAQLKEIAWVSYGAPIIFGLLLYLLSLIAQFFIWVQLLGYQRSFQWFDLVVYAKSILLKRLPGGMWHWVGRTIMYREVTQISPRNVMLANLFELCVFIGVAMIIFLAGWQELQIAVRVFLGSLGSIALGWLLYSWLPGVDFVFQKIIVVVRIFVLTAFSWFLGAAIVWLLVVSTDDVPFGIGDALWIWAISGGISMMIIVIPSGLGLREITLSALLVRFITLPEAIMVAVLIRFIFIGADIIWGGLGLAISNKYYSHTVNRKAVN